MNRALEPRAIPMSASPKEISLNYIARMNRDQIWAKVTAS